MNYDTSLSIGGQQISITSPCYFIADIAANHDGELSRAKELIFKAKEAGANVLVSGSTVFNENKGNLKKNIEILRNN